MHFDSFNFNSELIKGYRKLLVWYLYVFTVLLLFSFWQDVGLSTPSFEYVYNWTKSGNWGGAYQSCYMRCNESNSRSYQQECMCDIHCMFIGDCCYDYLMECDNRQFVLTGALAEQSTFYQRFKQYSDCKFTEFEDNNYGPVLQISSCPEGNGELTELCEGNDGSKMFSWYIPVIARGILFSNVYCAACHGIRLQEVQIATTRYGIRCKYVTDVKAQLLPFLYNFECRNHKWRIADKYKALGRTCECFDSRENMFVYSECDDAKLKDECHAYAAVIHPHGHVKVLLIGSG